MRWAGRDLLSSGTNNQLKKITILFLVGRLALKAVKNVHVGHNFTNQFNEV
jgi:hypothetical protein